MTSPTPPPYSGLGIASFAVSLIAAALSFALVALSGVLSYTRPDGLDEESLAAILIGLGLMITVFAELAAAGLGIGCLFQRDRRKLYGVLGLIFSIATLLVIVALLAFGLMQES